MNSCYRIFLVWNESINEKIFFRDKYSCNSPSLSLVNIVYFSSLRIVVSLTILKHVYQTEGTTLFYSPTNVGSPNQPSLEPNVLTGTLLDIWL